MDSMLDAFKARTADALDVGTIPAAVHRELELLWQYLTEAFPPVPSVGIPQDEMADLAKYFDDHPPETQLAAAYLARTVHRNGNVICGCSRTEGVFIRNVDAIAAINAALCHKPAVPIPPAPTADEIIKAARDARPVPNALYSAYLNIKQNLIVAGYYDAPVKHDLGILADALGIKP